MAQGTLKSKKLTQATAKSSTRRPGILGPQKGARTIKPKNEGLRKDARIIKKHSAGLTAMTERTLGAKAGHLELLKGGKKNKDAVGGKDKNGKPVEVKRGGSKKFG